MSLRPHIVGCSLLALTYTHAANAQEVPEPVWHKGVSAEDKQKAIVLFAEGQELNKQLLLGEARDKYEAALKHWDHPRIWFYLARVHKRMGLPLLAHDDVTKALAHPAALDAEGEGQEAQQLLQDLKQKELGALAMRCDVEGAELSLDGKPWGVAPKRTVMPGEHVITAKKTGYFTTVKSIAITAGKEVSTVVHLSVDATYMKRRWASWKPWTLLGAGAALGAVGGGLLVVARTNAAETTQTLTDQCTKSCAPNRTGPYDAAAVQNGFGLGAVLIGGAALVGGAGLVLLNLPQTIRTQDESDVQVEVVPMVSNTVAGISTRIVF